MSRADNQGFKKVARAPPPPSSFLLSLPQPSQDKPTSPADVSSTSYRSKRPPPQAKWVFRSALRVAPLHFRDRRKKRISTTPRRRDLSERLPAILENRSSCPSTHLPRIENRYIEIIQALAATIQRNCRLQAVGACDPATRHQKSIRSQQRLCWLGARYTPDPRSAYGMET